MSEIGDMWRDIKAASQQKRAQNRVDSARRLREADISFSEHNNGAHLIVYAVLGTVDFWPGTGQWIVRGLSQRHRGVQKLINYCKGTTSEPGPAPRIDSADDGTPPW